MKKLRVVELFAGVGGFRLGLESVKLGSSNLIYKLVFSNQYEPSTKRQHANEVYKARFGLKSHSGEDISEVVKRGDIPDHDLLVGGFPCQDYSVATSLKNSGGLYGKKGVLWWQIEKNLRDKGKSASNYLMLENVDRLLKSPADQRGRDFAVMLTSLNKLGYAVEWRVVNAADYGFVQKRRRVFILAFKKGTKLYQNIIESGLERWMRIDGLFQEAFPAEFLSPGLQEPEIIDFRDIEEVSQEFNKGARRTLPSPFANAGVFVNGEYVTSGVKAIYDGEKQTLESILDSNELVPEEFIISKDKRLPEILDDYKELKLTEDVFKRHPEFFTEFPEIKKWMKEKGSKKKTRKVKGGADKDTYTFAEGKMTFPDKLNEPSRTIITGEGGKSPSRFKHTVFKDGELRRLTPVELERLNGFPDNHTKLEGITDSKRAFFMGNALVVGIVEKLGVTLASRLS
jgi:DNA (cytosine-5)-methyltransferase 1